MSKRDIESNGGHVASCNTQKTQITLPTGTDTWNPKVRTSDLLSQMAPTCVVVGYCWTAARSTPSNRAARSIHPTIYGHTARKLPFFR